MRGESGPLCVIALELLHPNPGTDVRQASLSVFISFFRCSSVAERF